MTDTDPRLEAVAEAAEKFHLQGLDRKREHDIAFGKAIDFITMYDALRAFDQAHVPGEWVTTKTLDRLQDRIAELEAAQPEPESEVRPHNPRTDSGPSSSGQDNATAPVMGADPPWLYEAAAAGRHAYIHEPGADWLKVARAILAFAKARTGA